MDQAKLNMGYRFPTQYGQSGYAAFVVFNMMFGGDPSSVLFNEVREKQSLARVSYIDKLMAKMAIYLF